MDKIVSLSFWTPALSPFSGLLLILFVLNKYDVVPVNSATESTYCQWPTWPISLDNWLFIGLVIELVLVVPYSVIIAFKQKYLSRCLKCVRILIVLHLAWSIVWLTTGAVTFFSLPLQPMCLANVFLFSLLWLVFYICQCLSLACRSANISRAMYYAIKEPGLV